MAYVGLCIGSLLQRRRLHLSAVKKSSGVLHRLRDPQAGTPDPQAGAPGLLNVLKSTFAGAPARGATHPGRRFRRFVTRTYA